MDESQPNKPSGIPRPSKIPVQSRLPIPRSSLRPSASRESLGSSTNPPLRNPKLRTAPSRDRLAPTHTTATPTTPTRAHPTPSLRAASSPQTRTPAHVPASNTRAARLGPTSAAQPSRLIRGSPQPSQGFRSSSATTNSLRRQSSQQWISAAAMPEEDAGEEPMPSPSKLRPSLAERTMETLSRLPSSPSVKGRSAASFFDNGRKPPSRPGSRASRPGSSHQSEGSGAQSRTSRPGSSAGLDESVSSLRPQHAAYNPPLSPIEGTPLPLRNRRSINSLQAPSKNTPRPVRASMYGAPSNNLLSVPRARSPSPDRPAELSVPKSASKTPGPRLTKRPSATFKKPPIPTRTKPAADTPKKGSLASRGSSVASREGTYASSPSVTSASTGATSDSAEPGQTYKKASSALREQIAKAKAAKRAAAKQVSSSHPDAALGEGPQVPTDGDFDFGLANDPFNQHRDDKAQAKVIKSRLETARTSGRLNIAALGLREIPGDVLNMYNLDTIGSGGAWAESVDLTRFVAADNELEMISDAVFPDVDPQELAEQDDSQGNIFAGLETLDLHGNILVGLPMGLRRLSFLTSLNLSLNRLSNSCLEVVCQATSLKDLKLGGNLLYGALDPCFSQLQNLEILDLHGNNLSSLPDDFGNLSRLRILNLSENGFEALPFDILARLPLTELVARKNQLRGTLIPDTVDSLRSLQTLDVSSNQVVHVCSQGHSVAMPALNQLCVSLNRLQALPDTTSWIKLATLAADENSINAIPDGFTGLEQLRTADFSSNDIRIIPPEIGRMTNLTNLRLSGNPLRDKKFSSLSTDEIKTILAGRLAPPEEPSPSQRTASSTQDGYYTSAEGPAHSDTHSDLDDDFATPPTSAPASPARPRSQTRPTTWPLKSGGVLDRSNTSSSSLHPVTCAHLSANPDIKIREIHLHHNLFAALPESLAFFAQSLTILSLAHNHLVGETYLPQSISLPSLKELNLSHNHLTSLAPLVEGLDAPGLEKLDVSFNRVSSLPLGVRVGGTGGGVKTLKEAFPNLLVLLVASNHLVELEMEGVRGLRVVDVRDNDIVRLDSRLGLLGSGGENDGHGGDGEGQERVDGGVTLELLEVTGNRFRVPRWNVLEQGTEATLRWLRGGCPWVR